MTGRPGDSRESDESRARGAAPCASGIEGLVRAATWWSSALTSSVIDASRYTLIV